jgi:hypothetical protein
MKLTASQAKKIQSENYKPFLEVAKAIDSLIVATVNNSDFSTVSTTCHKDIVETVRNHYTDREYLVTAQKINVDFYKVTINW